MSTGVGDARLRFPALLTENGASRFV
jgi:hypothetical protein